MCYGEILCTQGRLLTIMCNLEPCTSLVDGIMATLMQKCTELF